MRVHPISRGKQRRKARDLRNSSGHPSKKVPPRQTAFARIESQQTRCSGTVETEFTTLSCSSKLLYKGPITAGFKANSVMSASTATSTSSGDKDGGDCSSGSYSSGIYQAWNLLLRTRKSSLVVRISGLPGDSVLLPSASPERWKIVKRILRRKVNNARNLEQMLIDLTLTKKVSE